jgi:hypothetical protein
MEAQPTNQPSYNEVVSYQQKLALEAKARNGVNWFFWIAGLSILNTVIFFFGGSISFVVGLGATQFVDGVIDALAQEVSAGGGTVIRVIGIGLDIGIAMIFVGAGLLGRKYKRWAIVTGMVLYALDALIFLFLEIWFSLLFHALALWGLWQGLQAIKALKALAAATPVTIPITPAINAEIPPWYKSKLLWIAGGIALLLLCFLAVAVVLVIIASA